ncbi:MAG: hypothetical protein R2813_08170 [Flavobacteriales bacterium]
MSQGSTAWKKYQHEFSVGYGFNNYLVGIGDNDQIGVAFMLQRSTFNASYRYFLYKHVALRGSFTHAYSRKNDKSIVDTSRISLPIDYQATLTEFAAIAEYHIFDETVRGRRGKVRRARGGMSKSSKIGLSFFTGLAFDYKRMLGEYQGLSVELTPYNPNGGFDPPNHYKKLHLHIPVGTQFRFVVSEHWRVGFEFGYRIGLKDYVDNVSSLYYTDNNRWGFTQDGRELPDASYVGQEVTFAKEKAPFAGLASEKGKRNYLFGTVTLAFRLKT